MIKSVITSFIFYLFLPALPEARAGLGVTSLRPFVRPSVTPSALPSERKKSVWALTEHPLTNLKQTWYTVSIWQVLEAYLFLRLQVNGQIWTQNISAVTALWAFYTENHLTDNDQTCYIVSIWQGLHAKVIISIVPIFIKLLLMTTTKGVQK